MYITRIYLGERIKQIKIKFQNLIDKQVRQLEKRFGPNSNTTIKSNINFLANKMRLLSLGFSKWSAADVWSLIVFFGDYIIAFMTLTTEYNRHCNTIYIHTDNHFRHELCLKVNYPSELLNKWIIQIIIIKSMTRFIHNKKPKVMALI